MKTAGQILKDYETRISKIRREITESNISPVEIEKLGVKMQILVADSLAEVMIYLATREDVVDFNFHTHTINQFGQIVNTTFLKKE